MLFFALIQLLVCLPQRQKHIHECLANACVDMNRRRALGSVQLACQSRVGWRSGWNHAFARVNVPLLAEYHESSENSEASEHCDHHTSTPDTASIASTRLVGIRNALRPLVCIWVSCALGFFFASSLLEMEVPIATRAKTKRRPLRQVLNAREL